MHYPPQQFMSDFGLPSQQPPIPMVVYFRRSRVLFYTLIVVGLLALLGTLFWFSHPSPLPVVFYTCVGTVLLYQLPLMTSIVRVLVLHQPALVITSAGIQILASAGSYSINWPEIGTISVDYYGKHRCFQIHPKNYPQYLSRLSAFKRFTIKRTTSWPNPPLQVPLLYLERPGVEILQQLSQQYARELDYYRISLQVAPEE